jgi:gluconolactonase
VQKSSAFPNCTQNPRGFAAGGKATGTFWNLTEQQAAPQIDGQSPKEQVMKSITLLISTFILVGSAVSAAFGQRIVSYDKRFDKIVPTNAKLEKIADGFGWAEGPVWSYQCNCLFISDVVNNSIYKVYPDGRVELFLKPSGYTGSIPFTGREPGSNGLVFDRAGRLVMNQHGNRRIARIELDGSMSIVADSYDGKRLNSPNDLVYKSNGDLYFTDPPFGLPKVLNDPEKDLDFQGVYRVTKDGKITLLTKEVMFPNGIAFSPDEKTLYVSNADRGNAAWYAFDVLKDGTLGTKREVYRFNGVAASKPGVPDGMKVDKNGYLFAAAPGGIHVIDPREGKLLGSFEFDAATANCAWAEGGKVLYITSNTAVYRVALKTNGAGLNMAK